LQPRFSSHVRSIERSFETFGVTYVLRIRREPSEPAMTFEKLSPEGIIATVQEIMG